MMKILPVFFAVSFISACANFIDSKEKPQLYEEKLAGEHSALASCVFGKLQVDGRSFMRILQFRNRQYPEVHASEILALDTRYLPNMVATYSPTNPDAVFVYGGPNPEILPYAHRNKGDESVYAFVLMLKKIDDTAVNATLKGDQYLGDIAWKMLQTCAASQTKP